MQHLEVSGAVVLYIGRTVSKGLINVDSMYIMPIKIIEIYKTSHAYSNCDMAPNNNDI
jgi:hypothetical protein